MARTYLYILANKYNARMKICTTPNLLASVYRAREQYRRGQTWKTKTDRLVYFEEYRDPKHALERKKEIAALSQLEREHFIERLNPHLDDLWPQVAESYHFDEMGIKVDKIRRVMTKRWYEHL
ncbi:MULTISPECIES: hypothetical protein [unclassified Oleiphilus]|uniref:hypothetical protein n=1 Tax=unclassified Oleiphilus TaxID=2631174 RepID=UPI0008387D37|nr:MULTISPECIES: hypothetical protein [unclassified Oleiphilus]